MNGWSRRDQPEGLAWWYEKAEKALDEADELEEGTPERGRLLRLAALCLGAGQLEAIREG